MSLNRSEILEQLFNQHIVERILHSMSSAINSDDDIISELYLYLCEIEEKTLIRLQQEGSLFRYIYTIIANQIKNPYSKLHKLILNYNDNRCSLDENLTQC